MFYKYQNNNVRINNREKKMTETIQFIKTKNECHHSFSIKKKKMRRWIIQSFVPT